MENRTEIKKELRVRVVNIMQYEEFLTLAKIENVVASYKTIDKYAYIKHDKDVDENGDLKKPHFHIVLKLKTPVFLSQIAGWFDIPANFINVPKGQSAFTQCCQYLTHETDKEQEKGKYRYEDNEVIANFDFRKMLDEYAENSFYKELKGVGKKQLLRNKVLLEGLKLSQLKPTDFASDWQMLQKCRAEYIKNQAPLPPSRVNFYITGQSATGKSLSSRALAKTLIDPENKLKDEEVYYIVGQQGALFQGYDGQPVIIWDDLRAMDLLHKFDNNPGAIFNLFDVIPSSSAQNIKFGSVKLINTINIVNSVQKFQDFVDVICFKNRKSEISEPDKQLYRRFPFFIELSASQKYDFFVNKQFFNEDEPNYKAYIQHKNLGIGLLKINNAYKKAPAEKQKMINKHFEKVDEKHQEAVEKYNDISDEKMKELQLELELEIEKMDNTVIEVVDYVMQDTPAYLPATPVRWDGNNIKYDDIPDDEKPF